MPYLEVSHERPKGKKTRPVNLFYELYGSGDTKCLLIMGLAGTHSAWAYQLKELAGTDVPNSPNTHTLSGNDIRLSATEQLEAEEKARSEKHRDSRVHASEEEEAVLEELENLEFSDSEESASDSGRRDSVALSASGSSLSAGDVSKGAADVSKGAADVSKGAADVSKGAADVSKGGVEDSLQSFGDVSKHGAEGSPSVAGDVSKGAGDVSKSGAEGGSLNGADVSKESGGGSSSSVGDVSKSSAEGGPLNGADVSKDGSEGGSSSVADVSKGGDDVNEGDAGKIESGGIPGLGGGVMCCAYDNRGVGRSTILKKKSDYNTTIMAEDALALMDHLGWEKAHVFGHSMGGMIACKLAAMAPHRIASLALISVTGGGFECIPAMNKAMVNISYRFLRAKDPAARADVDLDCHFTPEYLEETIEGGRRRDVLYKEYVKAISAAGLQPKHGLKGHENACWTHRVDDKEIETIRTGGFLVSIIHGRGDIVASVHHANKLAQRLAPIARLVVMPGGHLVLRESAEQVNKALTTLIAAARLAIPGDQWGAVLHSQSSDNLTTLATVPVVKEGIPLPGRGMKLRNYLNTFQDAASRKLLSIQRTSSGNVLKSLKFENVETVELQRTSTGTQEKLVLQV